MMRLSKTVLCVALQLDVCLELFTGISYSLMASCSNERETELKSGKIHLDSFDWINKLIKEY